MMTHRPIIKIAEVAAQKRRYATLKKKKAARHREQT
jgi:hypothetical protein